MLKNNKKLNIACNKRREEVKRQDIYYKKRINKQNSSGYRISHAASIVVLWREVL